MLLNNSLVLCPLEGMDQEDVEHWVNSLKDVFFNQAVGISNWDKHWVLEVVVKLYFYAAIVNQGLRMSLECAIEHIIR